MADTYTHGHDDSVLRSHRWRTAENSAAYVLSHLRSGGSLLDVGCGPGTLTADLARRVAPGRVVGIDAAEGVLDEARRATDDLATVEIEKADVYDLPFDDGSFDVVHAHQVLQHLSDPVAALREMMRVCASGGVVAARDADYGAMTWWPRATALDSWMEIYHEVARHNGAEPDAGRRLRGWARAAGAAAIESSASVWCFAEPEERDWWGGLWADRVVQSELATQAVGYGFATPGTLGEIATAWREWVAADDGWFVVVHGEVILTKR